MAATDPLFSSALSVIDGAHFDEITYNGDTKRGYITMVSMVEKQTGFYQADGQLTIRKSDVLSPTVGDVVVYEGETFRVGKIADEDLQTWTLEINRIDT